MSLKEESRPVSTHHPQKKKTEFPDPPGYNPNTKKNSKPKQPNQEPTTGAQLIQQDQQQDVKQQQAKHDCITPFTGDQARA